MGLGCSGTGPKAPEAGPLATDGLGLEELGVCGGSSSFAHTPPARVRTCAALGYYRSFLSHGRTPLWPAADRRACPRCARPKEGRVGRCRRKGGGLGGGAHTCPCRGRWSSAGSRGGVGSIADPVKGISPFLRAACLALPRPRPFPSWFPPPFALLQRALSLVRLRARQQLRRLNAYGSK